MYTIGKVAKKLGITVHTLRVWDKEDKLKPEYISNGGHRYYSEEQLKELIPKLDVKNENRINIGSGINYKKKGLSELLTLIATNQVDTLYIVHKDRLVRFGYELIEKICEIHNVKIEIINQSEVKRDEQEMIDDILNIIHVFSCIMNGKRSHINRKIMEKLKNDSTK